MTYCRHHHWGAARASGQPPRTRANQSGEDHHDPPVPGGGIPSPLLANIALSVLDEHFGNKWEALGPYWNLAKHLRDGGAVMKLIRYADDFVVLVRGPSEKTEASFGEVATVLATMSTISRLLRRRNAATRCGHTEYWASVATWKAELTTKRPKTAQQVANPSLHAYV